MSPVNGLLTAGDVVGGFYGAKLEVDGYYTRLTGQYLQNHASTNLTRVLQSPVVNAAHFYDDFDHYTAMARQGDNLVATAEQLKHSSKFTPPKIGGGLALAGIGYDIATGKDPVQATAAGGGGFLASVGAGFVAGAVVGTAFPVPGLGTAVGAVAGAVAGTFASGVVDGLFEEGVSMKAISRGGEALHDTGEAIVGGVVGAGRAITGLFD